MEEVGKLRGSDSLAMCGVLQEGDSYQLKQSTGRPNTMETEVGTRNARIVPAQCDRN